MECSGGKRGKPQWNKRPSGLIRRQIGCRAQRREESERENERERETELQEGGEGEFNILGRPRVLGPHISPCLHMSIQQAGFLGPRAAVPATTVCRVMNGFCSLSSCIFMLSQWAIPRNIEVIHAPRNVYMMVFPTFCQASLHIFRITGCVCVCLSLQQ